MILTMGYPSLRHQENAEKKVKTWGVVESWPDTQSRRALLGKDNGLTAKSNGMWFGNSPSVAVTGAICGPSHSRTHEEAGGFTLR
jgi:hypothetical protein